MALQQENFFLNLEIDKSFLRNKIGRKRSFLVIPTPGRGTLLHQKPVRPNEDVEEHENCVSVAEKVFGRDDFSITPNAEPIVDRVYVASGSGRRFDGE